MKKGMLLIVVFLYFTFNGFSQTTQSTDSVATLPMPYDSTQVFVKVDTAAKTPSNWLSYLQHNLDASVGAAHGAPPGKYKVIVQFIVSRDGSITDVRALTNYGYGMEQEAVRAIQNGPKWIPAVQNGQKVNAYRIQPITYQIEGN